jgi:hypothetical protein
MLSQRRFTASYPTMGASPVPRSCSWSVMWNPVGTGVTTQICLINNADGLPVELMDFQIE